MTSTHEELIRYRIEKRMAGRRDISLHAVVYVLVLVGIFVNMPWWDASARVFFAAFWAIPLLLHCLRYFYQNGLGAKRRADEIERELAFQLGRAALDEEEEELVAERIGKRITARRFLVAHLVTAVLTLPLLWLEAQSRGFNDYEQLNLVRQSAFWGSAVLLHWLRFYIVHGKTAAGRALKLEQEVERQWHLSLSRLRERRDALDDTNEYMDSAHDDEKMPLRSLRISDEGELVGDIFDEQSASAPH